jgi:tetratricopeptide (TPR) repeat protein
MKQLAISSSLAALLWLPMGTAAATAAPPKAAFAAADAAYKAYDRRDYGAAAARAREATRLAPGNRAYWALLVNSLLAAGRLDEAASALQQAVRSAGDDAGLAALAESVRRNQAQAAGAAMYQALEAGDLPAAAASARAALRYEPRHAGYRLTLVSVLLRSGQFAQAEEAADQALAQLPGNPAALALRSYARQRLGRWPEARDDLELALQGESSPAGQRQLRLLASDAALAAREPQRALDLLRPTAESDPAVQARRELALGQLTPHKALGAQALTATNFPPPAIDCANVDTTQTCAVLAGPPPDPAYAFAEAAHQAMQQRNYAEAAARAHQAAALAPRNRDYQLLLMNAAQAAGSLREAEQAASTALALDASDAKLLARRGTIRRQLQDAAGAQQDFNAALATGRLPVAAEAGVLADLGRTSEARQRLAQAQSDGKTGAADDAEHAYLAARLGDDEAARAAFARADAGGLLPDSALQDAGFAALRAGRDQEAVGYFKRAIDAAQSGRLQLSDAALFDARRAVAEVSRRWGVLASLNYRGGGGVVPGFGATSGGVGTKSLQAGAEAYWRPFGYARGRYVELFARGFQTLHSEAGPTGRDSRQTGAGVRWKPLGEHNAVLSLSRTHTRDGSPDNWLAQAAYSRDQGTDLRLDVPGWWTTRVSAEVGRYSRSRQSYGVASVQGGQSWRVAPGEGSAVLFPHLVLAAEYDSTMEKNLSVGAGPGVSARYWFGGDSHAAPRSYVDFSLQYRVHVSGDRRTKGVFATALISF